MSKILLIVLDGLGDRPVRKLGNRTPLEAAKTPNLDYLAKEGLTGLLKPVFEGPFPTSRDGHLALFGYNPKKFKIGRGIFEALGTGMELKKGDVALRGNFATVNEKLVILDRRAGRIEDTSALVKRLNGITVKGVKFLIKRGVAHRIAVVMRGKRLSDKISDGDLHKTGIKAPQIKPLAKAKEAVFTSEVLNEFLKKSHRILDSSRLNKNRKKGGLPLANYILLRGAGKFEKKMESFSKRWGMKGGAVAGGAFYKGIAKAVGMELKEVRGATGRADTNLKGKVNAAKKLLQKYDFCFLHIKATDIFGHDGDCLGKEKFIEKVDKELGAFLEMKGALVIVTGDHATPCAKKEHSADLVPVLIYGAGKDKVKKFSEKDCREGSLGIIKNIDLLKLAVKIKNRRTN
jgi:2,3-bisphosphoglycerate-independent phosphoglycerate mutase